MPRIVIVDYGVGNLYSVRRAVEVSGADDVVVSSDPDVVATADKIILPGVGAFEDGMNGLRERGLIDPLCHAAKSGTPLLGICLGMQLLASRSEEFGEHAGLDLIPGHVKAIPRCSSQGLPLKVPFIGWAPIAIDNGEAAAAGFFDEVGGRAVYLVHSFHALPEDPSNLLASYEFGGNRITAAICKDNVLGVQFHPEKSGAVGLAIIKRFIDGI